MKRVISYNGWEVGFDGATCGVLNLIGKQSPDIATGVDGNDKNQKKPEEQGAGDQGLMFGYACNESPEFMPAPIYYSHRLVEQQAKMRKKRNSPMPWLRPDAKSHVTLRYDKCEVQLSYAIGVAEPTSISVTTFGTGKISDDKIELLIREHFDLRPYGIVKMLDLIHPVYQSTAAYGHFGRKPKVVKYKDSDGAEHEATAFSWEKTDRAEDLRKAAKLK